MFFEMRFFSYDNSGIFGQFWATCFQSGLARINTLMFEIGFKKGQCAIPQVVEAEGNPNLVNGSAIFEPKEICTYWAEIGSTK